MDIKKYKTSNFINNFDEDNSRLYYSFHFSNELYHEVNNLKFGRLRVFNFYKILSKEDVYPYTNYNFESFYLVLEGKLFYKDDLGNQISFSPYDIFSISAGKGIRYSFQNKSDNNTSFLEIGFFPNQKSLDPQLQKLIIAKENYKNKFYLLATAQRYPASNKIIINQNVKIFFTIITTGNQIARSLFEDKDYYIYVIKGTLKIDNKFDIESRESGRVKIKNTSDILFASDESNTDLELLLIEMQKEVSN